MIRSHSVNTRDLSLKRMRRFKAVREIPVYRLFVRQHIQTAFPRQLLRHLGWRIVFTLLLLALLVFMGFWMSANRLLAAPGAQTSNDPLVLAFYYSWFDESTWTYDKLSDLPAEPYVSRDRGAMGRHIDQAKGAGIDALILAWYGPGGGPNQTETNLTAMLDEAAARSYKIGVLFETDSPFINGTGGVTAALQHLLSQHAGHPAFLRVDGRPVIFFWRPTIYGVETWRTIRSQIDPNYSSIWIGEGTNTAYLAVFDGHHLYSNTWNPPADLTSVNQKYATQVAAARQTYSTQKFWVATVMPGYNDVRVRPGTGFVRDRAGGDYYTQAWQAAMASRPNWIVINSFNEWPEGTYIEPSAAFGGHFLDATGGWSQQFRGSGGTSAGVVGVQAAVAPVQPGPAPTPTPVPTEPTAVVDVALLNMRTGPGTDFAVAAQLNQSTALPIIGRDPEWPDWWQVRYGDRIGWVYKPMIQAGGPLDRVPVVAAQIPTVDSQLEGVPVLPDDSLGVGVELGVELRADLPAPGENPTATANLPLSEFPMGSLRPRLSR